MNNLIQLAATVARDQATLWGVHHRHAVFSIMRDADQLDTNLALYRLISAARRRTPLAWLIARQIHELHADERLHPHAVY